MLNSAPRIRKQVYELTTQDFIDHLVWEFCSDEERVAGQDEATVRPTTKTELTDELPGACVIAATVTFADGSVGSGYLYNCNEREIALIQPNLLTNTNQVNFWLGWLRFIPNAAERVQLAYARIGKSKEFIFPLSFESTVTIKGRPLKLEIPGFMALGLDGRVSVME